MRLAHCADIGVSNIHLSADALYSMVEVGGSPEVIRAYFTRSKEQCTGPCLLVCPKDSCLSMAAHQKSATAACKKNTAAPYGNTHAAETAVIGMQA